MGEQSGLLQRVEAWLASLEKLRHQGEQAGHLLGRQLMELMQGAESLTAEEFALLQARLRQQLDNLDEDTAVVTAPGVMLSQWLWQWVLDLSDKTQLEWCELSADFAHGGIYLAGEEVGPGSWCCRHCGELLHLNHAQKLMPCLACGHGLFSRKSEIV